MKTFVNCTAPTPDQLAKMLLDNEPAVSEVVNTTAPTPEVLAEQAKAEAAKKAPVLSKVKSEK